VTLTMRTSSRFDTLLCLFLIVLYLILAIFLLTSCTTTTVTSPNGWQMHRVSFLQKVEIPELVIATNGTVSLRGYANSGGGDAIGSVVSNAVSAAVKAVK
jgi:hypothetical protein